jgi:hypothetical protein
VSIEVFQDYEFRYVHDVQTPECVRVYVLKMPDYGRIGIDHRCLHLVPPSGRVPPYINFKISRKPRSYEGAQRMAHHWATETDRIARTRYLAAVECPQPNVDLRDGIELARLLWDILDAIF